MKKKYISQKDLIVMVKKHLSGMSKEELDKKLGEKKLIFEFKTTPKLKWLCSYDKIKIVKELPDISRNTKIIKDKRKFRWTATSTSLNAKSDKKEKPHLPESSKKLLLEVT